MIKVLYLPLNAGSPQQGMYDAWEQLSIVDLKIFDFLHVWEKHGKNKDKMIKDFLDIVKEFQPDLIHMQLQLTGLFTPESLIEARSLCKNKVIITNWTGDIRDRASEEMIVLSPYIDYTLISSTGQIKDYEDAGGKNIKYWQIGYDPKLFFPKNNKNFKYNLIFAGNRYHANDFKDSALRIKVLEFLKRELKDKFGVFGRGHDKAIFGNVRPTSSPEELNDLYNSSACILNISHYNDVSHYFSDRLLICLSSGRPVISYRFPKYESYFNHNSDILIAQTKEDILNLLNYCLKYPNEADKIGINGFRKAKAEHTYFSRVIELLRMTGLL